MKKRKQIASAILFSASLLLFAGTASAHVTVWPKETKADSYERYTIRVPNEKDNPTTKVRVEFPPGTSIGNVLPVPGWTYEFEKDSEGRFKAITWTATAGGIKPNEFVEFGLSGKNPKDPGTLSWKSYQTYSDNSVVEWTGAPDSKTPAPVVTVSADTKAGDQQQQENAAAPGAKTESSTSGNTWPYVLSSAALLLSLVSLFRKKT
ncbi:YcnI family copper-binding membrane protein [Effusibacillus dendaii]|uniref:YncI copper-binding domain-containing protein n=1 Tax=Effusibacillus dendaii TaxID=2743772 RepID=A0A7I8DFV1_9BACL|nr:YcnI family protein [Effusibacillus dendaii]BCJ88192.1 hypothetical protein skT53_31770 [Effusibacillus dendaii]